MSSEVVIRAWGLGKQYRIGGNQQRYRTFREVVTTALVSPFARMARLLRGELQDAPSWRRASGHCATSTSR